jgi:hypothetical protein
MLQQKAGSSGEPLRSPVATSKPAYEISAKGRNETSGSKPARGKTKNYSPEGPHLISYRLVGGALIYVCADQQSSQWLIKAIDNHRLKSGTRLKATDARNLPKPVKVVVIKYLQDFHRGLLRCWMILKFGAGQNL